MPAGSNPILAHGNGNQVIQIQSDNSRPTTGSAPDDKEAIFAPAKVSFPLLPMWVEQSHSLTSQRISAVRSVALEQIARMARQPEVLLFIRSAF